MSDVFANIYFLDNHCFKTWILVNHTIHPLFIVILMVTLNVYESVSDWVDCVWVLGEFKAISRVIYGFWGWIYECEGLARCFKGFQGIYGGFFRGLTCSLSSLSR